MIREMWRFDRYTFFSVDKELQVFKYKPDINLSIEYNYLISDIEILQRYKAGKWLILRLFYYQIVLKDGRKIVLSSFLVKDLETVFANVKVKKNKGIYAYPLGVI